MDDIGVLIAAGGAVLLALLVVAIVVAARRERERRRQIAGWAARHGWAVEERPRVGWARRLPGVNGRVSLWVHGAVGGRPVGVADYSYTTTTSTTTSSNGSSSSSTTTHRYLVIIVGVPGRYPPITVDRRGALSRFGRNVFGEAASAIGRPDFDRQFRVRTRHPEVARSVLGPALVAEHLAGRAPDWSLADGDLLTWQPGKAIGEPAEIPALTAPLLRVAELLGR